MPDDILASRRRVCRHRSVCDDDRQSTVLFSFKKKSGNRHDPSRRGGLFFGEDGDRCRKREFRIFVGISSSHVSTQALQTIYDALPHDDIDLDVYDPSLTSPAKLDAFREIYKRSKDPDIWNEENVQAFRALRAELDPLRTVDLAGYLSFAAFLGAAYYVAALAVQWFLPEIFPAVYVFLVFLFSSPIIYTFFFS